MSLSNEIVELLSGYLDNQLNTDELRKVETALNSPDVRARFEELRQMREDLKAIASVPVRSLPNDFAERVLAAALQAKNPVLPTKPSSDQKPSSDHGTGRNYRWAAALVGIAATITLAVVLIRGFENEPKPEDIAELKQPDTPSSQTGNPTESVEEPASPLRFVRRNDLRVQLIMTLDLELSERSSVATTILPLFQAHGIQLIKGAKVSEEANEALNKMRVSLPPDGTPLPSEVYLLRAPSVSLDTILEIMRADDVNYPVVRFGMAFELPSDPLLDKLSADVTNKGLDPTLNLPSINGPIALGQAMADIVSQSVDTDDSFAAPLVSADQEGFRSSPFESIPHQGKMVSSAKRMTQTTLSLNNTDNGKFSFLLLFVRQR